MEGVINMDIDLKENLNNFIEKNVEIFLDGFFKCNYVIYQFNYSIEGEILNIMDSKSENYININLNQVYKIEVKNCIKLYLDNDIIVFMKAKN